MNQVRVILKLPSRCIIKCAILGHITAACISIQIRLDRELLWVPCRHHIGEVIVTRVWDALNIEVSKSPDITMFERYRKNYEHLSYSDLSDLYCLDV